MIMNLQQGDKVVANQDIIYRLGIVPKGTEGVVIAIADNFLIVDFKQQYFKKCVHMSEIEKIEEV